MTALHKSAALALGLSLSAFSALPSQAAIFDSVISFSVSSFNTLSIGVPPVLPVIGSVHVTLDTSLPYVDETVGISGTINIPVGSALAFTYDPFVDLLVIGGLQSSPILARSGTDDFFMVVSSIQSTPVATAFSQTVASQPGDGFIANFITSTGNTYSITPYVASGVPEPATWAMMLIGFAGLGCAARRRRVAAAA